MSPLAKFLTGFHMNHTCDEIPMDLKAFVTRIIIRLQRDFYHTGSARTAYALAPKGLDFDVALLGCGVYGVPLSAYIKRMGKIAIYTGGGTQAIFGIKGKRWDNLGIYNEHWVRPFPEDIPETLPIIEDGAFV